MGPDHGKVDGQMSQREIEAKADMDRWVQQLMGISDPVQFRRALHNVLAENGAKYGGQPGIIWKTIPPVTYDRLGSWEYTRRKSKSPEPEPRAG
jgi:hypothetical protein